MKFNKMIKKCLECGKSFEAKGRQEYCSMKCRRSAQKDRQVDINKTLCKQCKKCETFTYQRTLKRGKNKGKLFKFKYCKGNADIIAKNSWTLQLIKNKWKYVASSIDKTMLSNLLKTDKEKDIYYINRDSLDVTLKNLREISRACTTQTIQGDSIYPGVSKSRTKKVGWVAHIGINDKLIHLGICSTEEEAAHLYYSKCLEIGREINKETVAYKKYRKWLET
jgi:hypothetical protein